MSKLSVVTQKQIMKKLAFKQLQTSDPWEYAVSKSWLESWAKCKQYDEKSQLQENSRPSMLQRSLSSNSRLQEEMMESYLILPDHNMSYKSEERFSLDSYSSKKQMLQQVSASIESFGDENNIKSVTMEEDDGGNIYTPESQFRLYVSWFGLDQAHQLRRRPTSSCYMDFVLYGSKSNNHVLSDKELDFLTVWVSNLNNLIEVKDIKPVKVFAWDSIDYIGRQAIQVLGLKKGRKVRLWLKVQINGCEDVLEPSVDNKVTLLSKLVGFIPDLRQFFEARANEVNPKFVAGYADGFTLKLSLDEALLKWFKERVPSISIGVEDLGIDLKSQDHVFPCLDAGTDDEGELESIVTLSTNKNEWDDMLAAHVYKYTDEVTKSTRMLKDDLIHAAKEIVGEKLEEINEIRSDYEKRFVMLELKESAVEGKERELREKDKDLSDRLSTYRKGLEEFQKQKRKFNDDVERITAQNKISESRIALNIGGIIYTTSLSTLTKVDDSLFAQMFSGRQLLRREPDGSCFIDRDGVNFRYVLNYLRDGREAIDGLHVEQKLIKELLMEAKYYGLKEMGEALQQKLKT